MEWYIILGYAGAILTGVVLGLLGGGGALFSIPVLVYLFHIPPAVATGYSFFLIGVTATFGVAQNVRKQLINYSVALYYGVPSVLTVFVVRKFVIHQLPDIILQGGGISISKDFLILTLLSLMMLLAGYRMAIDSNRTQDKPHQNNYPLLALIAIGGGFFLGLVGAGGGFLMTPALIYFAGLDMRKALATSLLLVMVNSFIGFLGDVGASPHWDARFLFKFSCFSLLGMALGMYLLQYIDVIKLKKYFGWLMLCIGVLIFFRELHLFLSTIVT